MHLCSEIKILDFVDKHLLSFLEYQYAAVVVLLQFFNFLLCAGSCLLGELGLLGLHYYLRLLRSLSRSLSCVRLVAWR